MCAWSTPDRLLLAEVDKGLQEAVRRAGASLRCGRGCFSCCLGPFPISQLDALRLRDGLNALEETDPQEAARILARAEECVQRLPAQPAGDWLFGREWQMLPCPALDLDSGACLLYEFRPLACRTYGPAVTIEEQPLDPCPLNYAGWTPAQIDLVRIRIETGAHGKSAAELAGCDERLTTVAHALIEAG